jgi:hypothetical protein
VYYAKDILQKLKLLGRQGRQTAEGFSGKLRKAFCLSRNYSQMKFSFCKGMLCCWWFWEKEKRLQLSSGNCAKRENGKSDYGFQ